MPLISTSIPNLNGGVSQQPSSQRLENQCEAQENAVPLIVGGLIKRPPTEHVSQLKQSGGADLDLTGAFIHFIERDENEKYILAVRGSGDVYVYDLNGNHETVYFTGTTGGSGSSMAYLQDATQSTLRATTIGDVTFLLNTNTPVSMTSDTSTASTAEHEALLWIKATATRAKIKATVTLAGGTRVEVEVVHEPITVSTTNSSTPAGGATTTTTVENLDLTAPPTTSLASALETGVGASSIGLTVTTKLNGVLSTGGLDGLTGLTVERQGSVLYLKSDTDPSVDFSLTVEDHFGGSAHQTVKNPVSEFSDLPSIAKNGMIFLIQGDPESEVDDYYVKFETNGSQDFGEGIWVEAAEPGISYKLDSTTMPLLLVRQANNTWQLKHADGNDPAGNIHGSINWSGYKFTDRTTGGELTNPLPSFIGNKISDMNYFKGRLVFLSGENCSLSETGEFFNFFRTTVTFLPDTAPIDVGVGGTSINRLKRSQPFSDRLVLFSELTQFVLQGVPLLTPKTATITEVTNFSSSTTSSPAPAGNTLFFAFKRGDYSGIREFYKTNETDLNYDAVESSSQVPKYIEGDIKTLTTSNHEDLLIVRADPSNTLYAFKFFKTEQGRVQSAWFKMTFTDTAVLEADFIQQDLYLITIRDGKSWLEKMNFQTGKVDSGADYVTSLDNRIKVTGDGADSPAGGFTINLTNTARPDYSFTAAQRAAVQVVSADGEVMTIASTAYESSPTITLEEEFTASDVFYVGIPYTMKYEATKPTLKQARQSGGVETVVTGRHQLRYMTVVYDDTAFFKVKVTQLIADKDGDTIEYPFSGRFLSTGGYLGAVPSASGTFRFPVFAQSDEVKIEIENDSPLPSNIQSIAFEAQYTSRSARM